MENDTEKKLFYARFRFSVQIYHSFSDIFAPTIKTRHEDTGGFMYN